jgi:hypothetical protein
MFVEEDGAPPESGPAIDTNAVTMKQEVSDRAGALLHRVESAVGCSAFGGHQLRADDRPGKSREEMHCAVRVEDAEERLPFQRDTKCSASTKLPLRKIAARAEQPRTSCGDKVKVTNVQMEGDSEGAHWVAL